MRKYGVLLIALVGILLLGVGATSADSSEVYKKQSTVDLPILMYHRVFDGGHKSRYIITPKQLEEDLIELKKAGFSAVLPSEVIEFCQGKGKLPPRPVMLTFDDGHYNNLRYALPLFEEHKFKGVVNVIGKFSQYATTSGDSGRVSSSYLTWSEVRQLAESGLFEIGAHTYNMHDFKPRFGIRRLEGESDEDYRKAFANDNARLKTALEEKAGVEPTAFAYPFGAYYKDSQEMLSSLGYQMIFTTDAKINRIKAGESSQLLSLGRFNRESEWTSKQMIEAILGK